MVDDLDPIIDDVAREMTSALPDSGLARRVERCIANAGERRRRIWTRPALLAPLAATCVLVVAVFVARDRTPVERLRAPAPSVASAPTIVKRNEGPPAARVSTVVPVHIGSAPRVAASPLPAIEIAPLEIERLDVTPMVQVQRREIEIDPIVIARIAITPMP